MEGMFFHLKMTLFHVLYVERMSFHINGEGWLPVFQMYFEAFLLDMRGRLISWYCRYEEGCLLYGDDCFLGFYIDSFIFLAYDKNLPDIRVRIVFQRFGENLLQDIWRGLKSVIFLKPYTLQDMVQYCRRAVASIISIRLGTEASKEYTSPAGRTQ